MMARYFRHAQEPVTSVSTTGTGSPLWANDKWAIPFVVSRDLAERSNHERNQLAEEPPRFYSPTLQSSAQARTQINRANRRLGF